MYIPDEFFRDEVRLGFYIPTAIKQAWAAQLIILDEIDRICARHDIQWFADWGSLLGAVRHGGFVPWDDDLDICMRREDYDSFRAVADKELPPEFVIHDYERQEDHWLFLARVVNSAHISFDGEHLKKFHNYPYLAGVDIFLQDHMYRDAEAEKRRCEEVLKLLAVADGTIDGALTAEARAAALTEIREKYGVSIDPGAAPRDIGVALYRIAERQMARVAADESDRMVQLFPWGLKGNRGLPKEYYDRCIRLPFEMTTISVPERYAEVLSSRYGASCMQIKKVWGGHGYPSFEGQRELLQAAADFRLPGFYWEPEMLKAPRTAAKEARRVLFLPVGPVEWEGLYPYYREAAEDSRTEAAVMPLPLLKKDHLGQISATDEELFAADNAEKYPGGLNILHWYDWEPETDRFDRIYIQYPYDGENPVFTVPPVFYAENLRQMTDELIFVPAFRTGEFGAEDKNDIYNLKHYATSPGVIYSDRVIVQSENIRQRYIDKLSEFAGEETRPVWEARVTAAELKKAEGKERADAASDKIILFCIGLNEPAEHEESIIGSIRDRLDTFAENAGSIKTRLCFYPPDRALWEAREMSGKLYGIARDYAEEHGFDLSAAGASDAEEMAAQCDAYYGSPSPFVPAFTQAGKPVMVMNVSVDASGG